jgi:hypothetical protein
MKALSALCTSGALLIGLSLPLPSIAAGDPAAPELGRLFHSAERRVQLERQRQASVMRVRHLEGETLSLDGFVRRSGGHSTVWINRQSQTEAEAQANGVMLPATSGAVQARSVGDQDLPAGLRVGESLNRATGERDDRLGGGRISIQRQR